MFAPKQNIILALETSTSVCSIAISCDNVVIAEVNLHKKNSHAETITTSIQHILSYSKLKMKDLSAIALSAGPGSYTGLRIGASIAKGLCFTLQIPLISINTLEAMAFGMQSFNIHKALLCAMLDARRMEVYTLMVNHTNHTILPTCAMIIDNNSFKKFLHKSEVIFFGEGSYKCFDHLAKNENAKFLNNIFPRATNITKLAYLKFIDNKFDNLATFTPIYLKQFGSK